MPASPAEASTQIDRIHAVGARATPARIAVLRLLESAESALSHREIEEALATGFDRVTLYRVLDWLVESGLGHRITDGERVFRFSLAAPANASHAEHAHFRCECCGKMFCLADIPVPAPALPAGFSGKAVEYCVTGQCARCETDVSSDES
ncbi:transcriptional repressor [Uliginosibacterium sp. 31-16]|uniref:Fur family transcriptional regulator n=1 Tax=Uliginosibacterium sp. 31-16 TaxID=3068315 RepID=UPI00273F4DFA|nr:transcriptional repressor [Uliginosibacterium sp. 31-16]MDP5238786.1 transcriptional repressor [Uliginosibacterium sp. 31-16]